MTPPLAASEQLSDYVGWIFLFCLFFGGALMGVIAWIGTHIDQAIEWRRKFKERTLEAATPPGPPQPICGCDHHMSYHHPETGKCGHTEVVETGTQEIARDADGDPVLDDYGRVQKYRKGTSEIVACGCQRYVGPEPLPTYYAPDQAEVIAERARPANLVPMQGIDDEPMGGELR